MDRTQKIKADLDAYRASKQNTQPMQRDIRADLEAYRASKSPSIAQQKESLVSEGKPVSISDNRAEPTLGGQIVREAIKAPVKVGLSIARGLTPNKPVSINSKYLGKTSDFLTEMEQTAGNLADKYNRGEITPLQGIAGVVGKAGTQALDVGGMLPVEGIVSQGAKTLLGKGTTGLGKAVRTSLVRGGGYGAGYDVGNQLATGEQYNPMQTVKAAGIGVGADLGLSYVAPKILKGAGDTAKAIKPDAGKIMTKVARLNPIDAKRFKDDFGVEHGQYLAETGNYKKPEAIVEAEAQKWIQSRDAADKAMEQLNGNYKATQIKTALDKLVDREMSVSAPGAPSKDLQRALELQSKHLGDGLTMSEINEAKRLFERNVKVEFNKVFNPKEVTLATNIDEALRKWQFAKAEELGLTNLPDINKQTRMAKFITDKLGKTIAREHGNNTMSLTDWIVLSNGDPLAVSAFLTKKVFSNKGLQAKFAKLVGTKNKKPFIKGNIKPTVENTLRKEYPQGAVPRLPSASSEFRSTMPTGEPIPVNMRKNVELITKQGVGDFTPTKQGLPPQPKIKLQKPYTNTIPQKTSKVKGLINTLKNDIKNNGQRGSAEAFKNTGDLTTKILKDLEGKTTVSKQYILDATNRGELKQVERDITREILDTMKGDTINVKKFADKVKAELLPLKVSKARDMYSTARGGTGGRYENIALPDDLRGSVKNYEERIYESPIKTSAGEVHFGQPKDKVEGYFGHTRIEDMADNKTRRVIEVQSDLYQKGNLENMVQPSQQEIDAVNSYYGLKGKDKYTLDKLPPKSDLRDIAKYGLEGGSTEQSALKAGNKNLQKLQQYNDPTAHFRMIREEIKKAAQDGKTKLQFPTGETAMKIEGLGQDNAWFKPNPNESANENWIKLLPEDLKVGDAVSNSNYDDWIITDVLGDGKFKAVPKSNLLSKEIEALQKGTKLPERSADLRSINDASETFDISGKVDTNNPIYKFYEKDVQKYLNKFGGKRVVDDKGVSWIEIPIAKEQGQAPVEAFGKVQLGLLFKVAGVTALGALGTNLYNRREKKTPKSEYIKSLTK